MSEEEIMNLTKELNINEEEFENIEVENFSELEIKKMKKSIRKNININPLRKKVMVAAVISIIVVGSTLFLYKPAFAENIGVFQTLYEKLGYYKEYKDYSQFIGERIENKGYEFVIDNLLITKNKALVAIKISSPTPFNRENKEKSLVETINCTMKFENESGKSGAIDKEIYYIDDNNAIVILKYDIDGEGFKPVGNLNINIFSTAEECLDIGADFNFKINFREAFKKNLIINVNKKIKVEDEEIKIGKIEASLLGTRIIFGPSEKVDCGNIKIQVDDKIYRSYHSSRDYDKNTVFIESLTYEELKDANMIKIISICKENMGKENHDNVSQENKDIVLSNRTVLPIKTEFSSGVPGEIYKFEEKDGKIRVYYDCGKNTLAELSEMSIKGKNHTDSMEPIMGKDENRENGYYIEMKSHGSKEYTLGRYRTQWKYKVESMVIIR